MRKVRIWIGRTVAGLAIAGTIAGAGVVWVFACRARTEAECDRLLRLARSAAALCDGNSILSALADGQVPDSLRTVVTGAREMSGGSVTRSAVVVRDGTKWRCLVGSGRATFMSSTLDGGTGRPVREKEIPDPALAWIAGSSGVVVRGGIPLAAAYAPIRDRDGNTVALFGVEGSLGRCAPPLPMFWALSAVIVGCLLAAAVSSRTLAGLVERPLRHLAERAGQVAPGAATFEPEETGIVEVDELARVFSRMARTLESTQKVFHGYFSRAMHTLARLVESKDVYMKGHSQRVGMYAEKIALALGLPAEKAALMREMGELHDIGKLVVDERILQKEEPLTEQEWQVMRKHPVMSEEILRPVLLNREVLEIVRHHHERYDGTGYPDGLAGTAIPLLSQVLAVADAYDAMTSKRPYRKNFSREEAMEELRRSSGIQFNPVVVEAFLRVLTEEFRS